MNIFTHLGRYFLLLGKVLKKPEKAGIFRSQLFVEFIGLGVESLGIVVIISIFMGAIIVIQTSFNIDSPLIPIYTIGFMARQSMILEFSPTIVSLILAGKVGSRIASEIGTMQVTEQIDALEIMGVNPANYLILPKLIAAVLIFPVIIIISMFLGIFGGWLSGKLTGLVTSHDFIYGIQMEFQAYDVVYALIKTVVFAFIITTVAGYYGYYTRGGALEVGKASTKAVVYSSILIIFFNLILTHLLLS
jgi:phospholipid/cholesterol/gamma-HCH transport system permease protein